MTAKPPTQGLFAGQTPHAPDITLTLGRCSTLSGVLRKLDDALGFPAYFGNNLDALFDALCDPDWHQNKSLHVRLIGLEKMQRTHPEATNQLLEVLAAACAERGEIAPLLISFDAPLASLTEWPAQ